MNTVTAAPPRFSTERAFFTGMALLCAVIAFHGFAPSFFLADRPFPFPALVLVHGIAFSAWIALFVAQVALIAADRRDIHRKLGLFGMMLAAAMVVLATLAAVGALRAGHAPIAGLDPRSFFAIPMHDMLTFAVLVTAGLLQRRNLPAHKRLMLLATISTLAAALARMPGIGGAYGPPGFYGAQDLMIVACIVYDFLTRGRPHKAFVLGGLFVVLTQGLFLAIAGTPAWLAFADLFK